jgi:CheY-like chemotaxis protein
VRYLVVDDSRAMQSIIKRGVQNAVSADNEIKTAGDGEQALEIIRQWKPDLVLTDWHMPGMSGMDLMQKIQREMLDINVGFVTTENSEHRIAAAMAAGAAFVIQKPFAQKELAEAIISAAADRSSSAPTDNLSPTHIISPPTHTTERSGFTLPSTDSFAALVNRLTELEVLVEPVEPISVTKKQLPCLVGLLDDGQSTAIRAVCVLELRAACVLGAAIAGLPPVKVRQMIAQKTIEGPVLLGCRKLLKAVSATIRDLDSQKELQLRSVNVVPKIFPKLESIYELSKNGRSDFEVAVLDFGQGLMTIITA